MKLDALKNDPVETARRLRGMSDVDICRSFSGGYGVDKLAEIKRDMRTLIDAIDPTNRPFSVA